MNRWIVLSWIAAAGAACARSPNEAAPVVAAPVVAAPVALGRRAMAILETNCFSCHGKDGSHRGDLRIVLDREQLVRLRFVIPGRAAASPLYLDVSSDAKDHDHMPLARYRPSKGAP